MGKEFENRLQRVQLGDNVKENTAKAFLSTAEDTYEVLQEVKSVVDILEERLEKEKEQEKLVVREEDSLTKVNNRKKIDSVQIKGIGFNVYEYDSSYVGDLRFSTPIYHAQKLGMKLRSLEIELNSGMATIESGMFQSSEGKVELRQSFSPMHMIGGIVRKMNKETFFRPEFGGTGIVRLESNFKFIKLIHVPRKNRLVLEKGIYLASAGDWQYKTAKNFNMGMMFFSDKSILQTELLGSGIVALELPMHPSELIRHEVTQDRPFKVSGEYVLYWTGNLTRKINPARRLLGNLASGRGIVEEYTGNGFVYTAPTIGFYNQLSDGLKGKNTGSVNTLGDGADMGKQRKSFMEKIGLRGSRDYDDYEG